MEIMSALRLLRRRRLLVALGALAALALGAAASGYVAIGPFASGKIRSAIASVQIQIDTPEPLVADLRASELVIAAQTVLLAERLTSAEAQAQIARRAGVPAARLDVESSRTEIPGRASPLAREAAAAAGAPTGHYRVNVHAAAGVPIITVLAFAPDRALALKLARAAAPALDAVTAGSAANPQSQLRILPLAPARAVERTRGGPHPVLGVAATVIFFVAWCWLVLVADGAARAWRRHVRPPAPGARELVTHHLDG